MAGSLIISNLVIEYSGKQIIAACYAAASLTSICKCNKPSMMVYEIRGCQYNFVYYNYKE
jgi:hypothetical protein